MHFHLEFCISVKALSHWQVKHESARESRLQKQESERLSLKTFIKWNTFRTLSWKTFMKEKDFHESGILVIAVLIAAKGIYVTAFTIVQGTFACRNVVYFASFLRNFSSVQWLVCVRFHFTRHIKLYCTLVKVGTESTAPSAAPYAAFMIKLRNAIRRS